MSSRIWKFPLALTTEAERIEMPRGSAILTAGYDVANNAIAVWALVGPDEPKVARFFRVYPTGFADIDQYSRYISTVFIGGFVWHVFEDTP